MSVMAYAPYGAGGIIIRVEADIRRGIPGIDITGKWVTAYLPCLLYPYYIKDIWSYMTKEEKCAYWLELAQYDLDTASAMLSTGRWFYVIFMCQQAIEKCCKGLYTLYIDDNIPKIHNIKAVFSRFKDKLPVVVGEDTLLFFDSLSASYITYRYPDFKHNPNHQTGEIEAGRIFEKTKEVFSWLLTLKP